MPRQRTSGRIIQQLYLSAILQLTYIHSEINVIAMEKLNTLLIANRGEIAVRIIKTAK